MSKNDKVQVTLKIEEKDADKLILEEFHNNIVQATLNRSDSMNALDLHIQGIMLNLVKLVDCSALLITGRGERVFSAGDDVLAIHFNRQKQNNKYLEQYLQARIQLESELERFSMVQNKNIIVLFNGMCVGAGYAFAEHSNFRIVTENTIVNFPESQMGSAIPCVKFLSSLEKQYIIRYMIATGSSLKGQELVFAGLADYEIPSTKCKQFEQAIHSLRHPSQLREVVVKFASKLKQTANMLPTDALIKKYFSSSCLIQNVENLEDALSQQKLTEEEKTFCKRTLDKISRSSPLALRVNFQLLEKAATLSDTQAYQANYASLYKLMSGTDFQEAVLSKLVSKKKNQPIKFQHKSILEVPQQEIDQIINGATSSNIPHLNIS